MVRTYETAKLPSDFVCSEFSLLVKEFLRWFKKPNECFLPNILFKSRQMGSYFNRRIQTANTHIREDASLRIMGAQLRTALKPLNTIVL